MESLEQRLRELLGQVRTVEEIIRSDLDSLRGRMRVLRNRVELATITLHVVQVVVTPSGSGARGWAGMGGRLWVALLRGGEGAGSYHRHCESRRASAAHGDGSTLLLLVSQFSYRTTTCPAARSRMTRSAVCFLFSME